MTTVFEPDTDLPVVYDAVTGMPAPMRDAFTDDLDEAPHTDPAWWNCPTWCQPAHCYGGSNHLGIVTARVHTAVHYAAAATNPDFPRHLTNVELLTIQLEDPDGGLSPTETVLRIGDRSINAGPIAAGLADALHQIAT